MSGSSHAFETPQTLALEANEFGRLGTLITKSMKDGTRRAMVYGICNVIDPTQREWTPFFLRPGGILACGLKENPTGFTNPAMV